MEFPEPAFHASKMVTGVAAFDELEEIAIAKGVPIHESFYDFPGKPAACFIGFAGGGQTCTSVTNRLWLANSSREISKLARSR